MPSADFPETGILGFPWLFILPAVVAVAVYLYRHRGHLRQALFGKFRTRGQRVGFAVLIAYVWVIVWTGMNFDPINRGTTYAPGPGIAAVRAGGEIYPFDAGSSGTGEGPLYSVEISPGEEFSVLTSIANGGPVPITFLGPAAHRTTPGSGVGWFVSGAWRAPDSPSAAFPPQSELVPFQPITLDPGEQAPIVMTFQGGSCATGAGSHSRGIIGYPFVYDLLSWRRVGYWWPQFEISARVDRTCLDA